MASMDLKDRRRRVVIGVGTHKHVYVAVSLDELGPVLADTAMPADRAGHERPLEWARSQGNVLAFGIEGTGSYGAAFTSLVRRREHKVIEVARQDRRERRSNGKSDLRCAGLRPGEVDTLLSGSKHALRSLARRWKDLHAEITAHEELPEHLVHELAPQLLEAFGIAADTAAELLIVAGDNPERIRTEAAWAKLCGVSPIPASSGTTTRHRLNRGGHWQTNAALYRTVIVRMRFHQIAYLEPRAPTR